MAPRVDSITPVPWTHWEKWEFGSSSAGGEQEGCMFSQVFSSKSGAVATDPMAHGLI